MDEDLKNASAQTISYSKKPAYYPHNQRQKRQLSKGLIILPIVILLLTFIGFAVWKLVLNKPKAAPIQAESNVVIKPKVINDTPSAPVDQNYSSSKLGISFKYPLGWKVAEANGGIRIESPGFEYPGSLAGSNGNFRIYIRQTARDIDSKYIGRGVVIKPSEKFIFTNPAYGQHSETLLSSFGLDTADNFGFFLIVGNFQLKPGDTLGLNYGKEPETYIIAGGYSTPAAIDDLAMTPVSITYYSTSNAFKQSQQIISSLQLQ